MKFLTFIAVLLSVISFSWGVYCTLINKSAGASYLKRMEAGELPFYKIHIEVIMEVFYE